MQKTFVLLTIVALIGIGSCQGPDPKKKAPLKQPPSTSSGPSEDQLNRGFQLLETQCFSCHSPQGNPESRIAPPMAAVKRHYIRESTRETEFIRALTDFVQNPSETNAHMPGAVERFGLMPRMEFSDEDLEAIARYIYHEELEAPAWFEQHYQKERKKRMRQHTDTTESYEARGRKHAMATKAVLGKNLMQALQQRGAEHALTFCSTRAITLTDSMAKEQGVRIKRVSDKHRNPQNAANEEERAYIRHAQQALAAGEQVQGRLTKMDGTVIAYYPIVTNAMCLQCHGVPGKDIQPAVQSRIAELYPNDLATGYGVNEVRGIWVVEMGRP